MKYIALLFIAIIGTYGLPTDLEEAPEGWEWIPQADGSFKLVSVAELEVPLDAEFYKYDAYRDMVFYLYTRKNPKEPQIVKIDDIESLKASNFNPAHETRMAIHGWGGNGRTDGTVLLPMRAYLEKGDYNFFGVDWHKGYSINYVLSAKRSNATGTVTGKFIEFLIRDGKANIDDFQISGFSLGGQMIAFAGKYLKGQLPAIYGLDPAGPMFLKSSAAGKLDKSDAKYVEVIHTAGMKFGHDKPLGHVDFYVNGGRKQPGCIFDVLGQCAHMRSLFLFTEGITSENGFYGLKCSSRDQIDRDGCHNTDGTIRKMGEDPKSPSDDGAVYYLKTNKRKPYAMGKPE